jgi:hypothetical protein
MSAGPQRGFYAVQMLTLRAPTRADGHLGRSVILDPQVIEIAERCKIQDGVAATARKEKPGSHEGHRDQSPRCPHAAQHTRHRSGVCATRWHSPRYSRQMASIHIREIQKILADRGATDALPWGGSGDGYFLEIRFDDPERPSAPVDPEFSNKVITAESSYGSVVIQFDESGQLRSLDLS